MGKHTKTNRIMIVDTEYDTMPKRLLALAYIIYENNKVIKEVVKYIKYSNEIFKVNENAEAFKYHKLTNKFLQENGESIETAINTFNNDLTDIDLIIGQNILSADIQIIRKEAIGTSMWYGKIREKIQKIQIYDTMYAFRLKVPEEKSSLDNIYKYLFDDEMENHHNAMDDCKNTYKCYMKMIETEYTFENQIIKFTEDVFDDLTKICKKCDICEAKLLDNNIYKFINKTNRFEENDKSYIICNNILKEKQEICKKCFNHHEVMIINNNTTDMIDIVKFKNCECIIDNFFEVIGDKENTIYLKSSYADKDDIKKLGGRWNSQKKVWYFTYTKSTTNRLDKFSKWIEKSTEV
jgi:DNA polymerase III epsilon subunit-like protein|uniref:Exonuclease domain-containing protein n=1 Tax=viral metagenome TaxID=1070528 RepID=A0A6C0IUR5_9ZZZZ